LHSNVNATGQFGLNCCHLTFSCVNRLIYSICQHGNNSVAGTERQRKLLLLVLVLHPSRENKPAHQHRINEKWNTHAQISCDKLATDKATN